MGDPCEREATTNDTNVSLKNKRFLILFIFLNFLNVPAL